MEEIQKSVGNDQIRSLKVHGGVKVKLYKVGGEVIEFTAGHYDVDALEIKGFSNQASSMKVEWGDGMIY